MTDEELKVERQRLSPSLGLNQGDRESLLRLHDVINEQFRRAMRHDLAEKSQGASHGS